jgi:hypothetical protein
VNYTTLEDVPEGIQVMVGMFSVNHRHAIVLFDSGASHTFISQACVARVNLQVTHMKRPYIICAPSVQLNTNQLIPSAPHDLSGKIFQTKLIVHPSKGIYVILGMNWMKENCAIINTSSHVIQLKSPAYGPMDIHLSQHEIPTNPVYQQFMWFVNTPMCFRRSYPACLQIRILNSSLSYNPAQHPYLEAI